MKIRKDPPTTNGHVQQPDPAPPAGSQHAVNQKREPKFKSYDYRAMAEVATLHRHAREQDPINHPTPPPIPEKTLGQVVRYREWEYMPFGKHSKYGPEKCLLVDVPESYLVWVVSEMEPAKLKQYQGLRETIEGILLQRQIAREREDPWKKLLGGD
jgi:uncharacterized protein (DUF3820 family)